MKKVNKYTINLKKDNQIKIACNTEEKAKDFIDFCYKNNFKWELSEEQKTHFNIYKENTYYTVKNGRLLFGGFKKYLCDCNEEEVLEWEIIKEPSVIINDEGITFKGVIKVIQDGEIWRSNRREIKDLNGDIMIKRTKNNIGRGMVICNGEKFFKVGIPFEEAFIALKNGKPIRSLVTEYTFVLKDNKIAFIDDSTHFPRTIVSKELLGMWEVIE